MKATRQQLSREIWVINHGEYPTMKATKCEGGRAGSWNEKHSKPHRSWIGGQGPLPASLMQLFSLPLAQLLHLARHSDHSDYLTGRVRKKVYNSNTYQPFSHQAVNAQISTMYLVTCTLCVRSGIKFL